MHVRIVSLVATISLLIFGFPVVGKAAATASFSVSPSEKTLAPGDTLVATFVVNSGGQAISAVKVVVRYSSNLEYVSNSDDGTVFDLQVKAPKPVNNEFSFERLHTESGYNGSSGTILTITFKALATGTATINLITADSQAISYDSPHNVLASSSGATYTVETPVSATATPTSPPPTSVPSLPTPSPKNTTKPKATAKPTPAAKSTVTPSPNTPGTPAPTTSSTPIITPLSTAKPPVATTPLTTTSLPDSGRPLWLQLLAYGLISGGILLFLASIVKILKN